MAKSNLPRSSGQTPPWQTLLKLVASLILALLGKTRGGAGVETTGKRGRAPTSRTPESSSGSSKTKSCSSSAGDGAARLVQLFNDRQSDQIVTATGTIVKILPDDIDTTDGSGQHQRLLVEITPELTVKLSHNLKFGRIAAREGDEVKFKGEYEWNNRGGSVHWTHHDPKGWHEDGWVEYRGERYG